jgi:hypothetical protein
MRSNWRSPPRPVAKSAEQGRRITGDPGKSVEGERERGLNGPNVPLLRTLKDEVEKAYPSAPAKQQPTP